ncbi:MAG: hypothetical protein QXT86_11430 [Archaeoglobaceae archaeon]
MPPKRRKRQKTGTALTVDRKYKGLGDAFTLEFFIKGLAPNIQEEFREIGHCVELMAFPDLKYGWTKIPKEVVTGLRFSNMNNKMSPLNRLFAWQGPLLYIYNLRNETYTVVELGANIRYADGIDDITCYAILENNTIVRIINNQVNAVYGYSGSCGEMYRGRLFIGDGKVLRFSSPAISDPNFTGDPFATANGGGWIILSYPNVTQIVDLRVINDMLYIFTDGGLFFLTSAMTSNVPSSFYLSETGLKWSFERNKILSIHKKCMVVSEMGLFELITANLERKSLVVDNLFPELDTAKSGLSYHREQNFLIIPYRNQNKSLCYSFEYDLFFNLPFKVEQAVFSTQGKAYGLVNGYFSKLFQEAIYYPFVVKTVYHNLGVDRFKFLREIQLRASARCHVYVFYDGFGVEQGAISMGAYYGDLWSYRNPFNRKGNKISFYFAEATEDRDFYLSLVKVKGHILGEPYYFYGAV